VDADGDPRVRADIRKIRDRLLGEHLGLTADTVARGIEHAGSVRSLIDARKDAEHTLVRIELAAQTEASPPAALRAVADPDEPIWFGSAGTNLVPPADATNGLRPLPIPIVTAIVIAAAIASTSTALILRPEFRAVQDTLDALPGMPSMLWIGGSAFVLAILVRVPLELMAVAAGVLFGALRGGFVALVGSLLAAAIGYVAGRAIGAAGVTRWMSRRSYRSVRQLGARGIVGVVVLRLASVATAGSIHLLCGAGRVPFASYIVGTAIGLVPSIAALIGLGALVRHALLNPSVLNGVMTIVATLILIAGAAALRTLLLARQFAPSVSHHRARAEFG
jgi:uncharacterized membrane protein YdjX (TVP38/TMEM64 family)